MKADTKNLAVGWYLEPPFNDPRKPGFFQTQHWWSEEPWFDCETGERKPISREAALYELARRHPISLMTVLDLTRAVASAGVPS